MEKNLSYEAFEQNLLTQLCGIAQSHGVISGELIRVDELDEAWHRFAPEYMADAVPNVVQYPSVAIAWAAYFGMAMALVWDTDWSAENQKADHYKATSQSRGFDLMDEYVMEAMYGYSLDSTEAHRVEEALRSCAQAAQTLIRKEGVEAQSKEAFFIFARAAKVMYEVGVAMGLTALGYKYEKATVSPRTIN